MLRKTIAILIALLTIPAWAAAQQGTSQVQGRVVDAQGAVLPGVTVTIRNEDTGMFRETQTNADGGYLVAGVTPGPYSVTAALEGFKTHEQKGVRLEVGRTVTLDATLSVGSLEEQVTVQAETPLVDVTSKSVGGNISARELSELPSPTRNFIGFVGLLPGVVANVDPTTFGGDNISVNGQDSRNNSYALDGGANNDNFVGQRGGMQARPPLETIQEFQVITSQFNAEFGRTTGAFVNAVMKSGTNDFRGVGFSFFKDSSITTRDYFARKNDLPKSDTMEQQFGGVLGGPILKDKLHFFTSVERVRKDTGVTVNIPARPELNRTTAVQDRVWNTLIRIDNQLSANNTWDVRWLRDQTPQLNKARPDRTFVEQENDIDQSFVGTLSSVLGNATLNSLRVTYTREDVKFANPQYAANGGRQELLDPQLTFLTFSDGQANAASSRLDEAWQVTDTFSLFKPGWGGDHDMKFGVQYLYGQTFFTNDGNLNGMFTFSTNGPFDPGNPRSYPERLSIRVPSRQADFAKAHYLSLFGQDTWKVGNRLTLSLGLRYDLEVMPINEADNPFISDANAYPVDKNNFQPRLGFTYNVEGDGRSIVRGGAGRFYETTYFELISALVTSGVYSSSFTVNFPANAADAGPSNGRLPTDPMLRNGPVVNRDLLTQLYPPGTRVKNTGTVTLDNPDRTVPYTDQLTVGYQRQLWNNTAVSADYIHETGNSLLMSYERNPGIRVDTSRTGRVDRVDPNFVASVQQRLNAGETTYDGLQLQFEKRYSQSYSARVAYTLGHMRGNTGAVGTPLSNFQVLDDLNLDLNEGPGDNDRRHLLTVSGSALVPKTGGVTASWVMRWMSGSPFTIADSNTDPDRNGILIDPIPAGTYTGSGADSISVDSDGGRNGARGPRFFQADVRFGYRFQLGGTRTLNVFGEVFNITNFTNFASPSGDRRATDFLVLTAERTGAIPRTAQFGVRFAF